MRAAVYRVDRLPFTGGTGITLLKCFMRRLQPHGDLLQRGWIEGSFHLACLESWSNSRNSPGKKAFDSGVVRK
jgi:hypothetical protein